MSINKKPLNKNQIIKQIHRRLEGKFNLSESDIEKIINTIIQIISENLANFQDIKIYNFLGIHVEERKGHNFYNLSSQQIEKHNNYRTVTISLSEKLKKAINSDYKDIIK